MQGECACITTACCTDRDSIFDRPNAFHLVFEVTTRSLLLVPYNKSVFELMFIFSEMHYRDGCLPFQDKTGTRCAVQEPCIVDRACSLRFFFSVSNKPHRMCRRHCSAGLPACDRSSKSRFIHRCCARRAQASFMVCPMQRTRCPS